MTPTLGGPINETFFYEEYNPIVQAALASSPDAYVIIDVVRSHRAVGMSFLHRAHSAPAQLCALERRYHLPGRPDQRTIRLALVAGLRAVRGHPACPSVSAHSSPANLANIMD